MSKTRIIVPAGTRFGRLIVLEETQKNNGRRVFSCICDCGEIAVLLLENLRSGHSKSCGCLHREVCRVMKTVHGKCRTRSHNIWSTMLARCYNPNNKKYHRYGGRGITVCKLWQNFEGFYRDMGDPPEKMSIDRIDNNGNYCKENCRWATQKQQGNNTSTNVLITFDGRTQTVTQWAEEKGLKPSTIFQRIYVGRDINRLLLPLRSKTAL